MDSEIKSLESNSTWTLTELPKGKKAIKSKCIYKTKQDNDKNIVKYKARLVAKGCSQKYGIDFTETYSPVIICINPLFNSTCSEKQLTN